MSEARRRKPPNKKGCKPVEDVCVEHDRPLICRHGCESALPHKCKDILDSICRSMTPTTVNGGKTEHHIWCNFWGTPLETCKQCAGLYERYPMDGMTEEELAAKHFPDAIARTGTTQKPCDSTSTYATVQMNKTLPADPQEDTVSTPRKTVDDILNEWMKQPGAVVTPQERQFIEDMRKHAANGVGYGWMQQVIEWEWQAKTGHAWGPKYFESRIRELETKIAHLSED